MEKLRIFHYTFFIPFYSDLLIILSSFLQGDAKNTFGTGAFMLFNTGDEPLVSQNGMVTTVGFQFGKNKPAYALEGSIASAGSAIKWTRDNLGLISSSEEIGPLGKQRNELCL
jgi:glycerol kinase